MKTTKPLLEDKLVTWARAYHYILEELTADQLAGSMILGDLRAAAARTAAILIQGVDHSGNDPTD